MHEEMGVGGAVRVLGERETVRSVLLPGPRQPVDRLVDVAAAHLVAVPDPAVEAVRPARSMRRVTAGVVGLDGLTILVALVLAWPLRFLAPHVPSAGELATALWFSPLLVCVWFAALALNGAYKARGFGDGAPTLGRVGKGTMVAAFAVSTLCLFTGTQLSLGFLVAAFVIGSPLLLAERSAVGAWVRRRRLDGTLTRRVLGVGSHRAVSQLTHVLNREPALGYEVIGCTLTDPARAATGELTAPAVGSMHDIGATCVRLAVDTVMVTGGSDLDLRELVWALEGQGIELIVVPELTDVSSARVELRPVVGLPLLHVEEPRAKRSLGWMKRAFDLAGASSALFLLAPLMLAVAALIRLGDGGPVFYRQARVGLGGAPFGVWKFRSMAVDAETIDAALRQQYGYEQGLFKLERDPRVTRVGRFIRRYSLDELPQLFNVITGSMSLVGPRPHMMVEAATYGVEASRRLDVRPGMTGLWQVSGRSDLSWSEAVRLDLSYRDNWSPLLDLTIIARTVKAVIATDGAY